MIKKTTYLPILQAKIHMATIFFRKILQSTGAYTYVDEEKNEPIFVSNPKV
jgi:hypothetical protein